MGRNSRELVMLRCSVCSSDSLDARQRHSSPGDCAVTEGLKLRESGKVFLNYVRERFRLHVPADSRLPFEENWAFTLVNMIMVSDFAPPLIGSASYPRTGVLFRTRRSSPQATGCRA